MNSSLRKNHQGWPNQDNHWVDASLIANTRKRVVAFYLQLFSWWKSNCMCVFSLSFLKLVLVRKHQILFLVVGFTFWQPRNVLTTSCQPLSSHSLNMVQPGWLPWWSMLSHAVAVHGGSGRLFNPFASFTNKSHCCLFGGSCSTRHPWEVFFGSETCDAQIWRWCC